MRRVMSGIKLSCVKARPATLSSGTATTSLAGNRVATVVDQFHASC